jgi:hypothetical protein
MKYKRPIFACISLVVLIGVGYAITITTAQQPAKRDYGKVSKPATPIVDNEMQSLVSGLKVVSLTPREFDGQQVMELTVQNISNIPIVFFSIYRSDGTPSRTYFYLSGEFFQPGTTHTLTFAPEAIRGAEIAATVYANGRVEGEPFAAASAREIHDSFIAEARSALKKIKAARLAGKSPKDAVRESTHSPDVPARWHGTAAAAMLIRRMVENPDNRDTQEALADLLTKLEHLHANAKSTKEGN